MFDAFEFGAAFREPEPVEKDSSVPIEKIEMFEYFQLAYEYQIPSGVVPAGTICRKMGYSTKEIRTHKKRANQLGAYFQLPKEYGQIDVPSSIGMRVYPV